MWRSIDSPPPDAAPDSRERAEPLVLHADNHLLVLAKPAGWPTVPDASGDQSLLGYAREWVRERGAKPGNVYLGVVHRLDRPVSGVVVIARTSKAAARLSAQFRAGMTAKRYWGVSDRAPVAGPGGAADAGVLEHWLRKDQIRNVAAVVATGTPGARLARTAWRVVERSADGRVLIEFVPDTGRAHQLRVAAAALGAPLLGDLKYGAAVPLPDRSVALHAAALTVEHPTRHEPVTFEVPPPMTPWWQFATTAMTAATAPETERAADNEGPPSEPQP